PTTFLYSFFLGNWSEPMTRWIGDASLISLSFPFLSSVLACPAAWCIMLIFHRARWSFLEKLCVWLVLTLVLFMIRPFWLTALMQHLPILRSMRWPFREGMLFLFYIHLLFILRFAEKPLRWQPAVTAFSLLVFLLPLPFIRPPSLNPLTLDRELLFSGKA